MAEDKEAAIKELEKELSAPDAVLKEDIFALATSYVKYRKGRIKDVIQRLSDNYVGYPAMASLVCQWLAVLRDGDSTNEGGSSEGTATQDEFSFLSTLVQQSFCSARFNSVLNQGRPPEWLEALTRNPRERELIYTLAAEHPDSLILGWAIKRILLDGHEQELLASGRDMATYFGVFHRLLRRQMEAALDAHEAEQGSSQQVSSWNKIAHVGLHTYLCMQALLSHLHAHTSCPLFRHVSQVITRAAEQTVGVEVYMLLPLFMWDAGAGAGSSMHTRSATLAAARVLSTSSWKQVKQADLERLLEWFTGPDPPPVSLLHTPRLFELLSGALYEPRPVASESFRVLCSRVLAIASCLPAGPTGASQTASDGGPAPEADDPWQRVNAASTGLLTSARYLRDLFQPGWRPAETFEDVDAAVGNPMCAACIVHAIRSQLTGPDFFTDTLKLAALPHLTIVLLRAASLQRCAQPLVLQTVAEVLPGLGAERLDPTRAFLRLLLELLLLGCAGVMNCVRTWAAAADPALVRYFTYQVLTYCMAPYSAWFVEHVVELMRKCGMQPRRDPSRGRETRAHLLQQFVSAANEIDGLSDSCQQFVQGLAKELDG